MNPTTVLAVITGISLILAVWAVIMLLLSRDERRELRTRVGDQHRWLRDNADIATRHSNLKSEVDLIKEHLKIDIVYNPEKYRHVPEQIVVSRAAPKSKARRGRS